MRRAAIAKSALCLLLAGTCLACGPAGAAESGAALDLMKGYWRSHYTLAPVRTDLDALAREQKRAGFCKGVDLSNPYLDYPFYFKYQYSGHAETSPLTLLVRSPPPPPNWMQPGFDCSSWPRRRRPLLTRGAPIQAAAVRLACFRSRVVIGDPARVKRLRLTVVYRGGVVVYVNGHEIARGHLPDGRIAPGTPGETYPLAAHVLPPAKIGKLVREDTKPFGEITGPFPGPTVHVRNLAKRGDIPGELVPDVTTRFSGNAWLGYFPITRDEWNTLRRRRDRELGPIEIPGRLLRKGANVLAVEIHRSDYHPAMHPQYHRDKHGRQRLRGYRRWYGHWQTACFPKARLACEPAGAARLPRRPREPRVWVADPHRRLLSSDFPPTGEEPGRIRMVGARNGTYSGQVVLSTAAELPGITATATGLSGPGGAEIPAAAVQVRYARGTPLTDLRTLGYCRWGSRWRGRRRRSLGDLEVARGAPDLAPGDEAAWRRAKQRIRFFDHLSADPPPTVPADSCQPVWVTVRVPRNASAGRYTGAVSVRAGGHAFRVPVALRVMDWALPDPADFATVVALEQSPYGVAKQYQVPLWSAEHFKLVDRSMRWLGQVGGDMLIVPVLTGSEFGNRDDSMVRWTRKGPGRYACDLAIFAKYLDAARRHVTPRCVCFVVSHATDNNLFVEPRVLCTDGKRLDVPRPGTDEARAFWRPFVDGVRRILRTRDLLDAWHWGFHWDCADNRQSHGYVAGTVKMLGKLAPGVGWARACHTPGRGPTFGFVSSIYSLPRPVRYDRRKHTVAVHSHKGWKNPRLHLALPRIMSTTLALKGTSPPFAYRLVTERALIGGGRGVGRMGVDYWRDAYQDGWAGGGQVGMSVVAMLWPGPRGAESGARFEAFREGLQESEARIFLERTLEDPAFSATDAGQAVQAMLDRRIRETLFIPQYRSVQQITECFGGWQERSWDLYAAAARAAGNRAPAAPDRDRFFEQ
ncbi:MAG: hypothetical protein R6V58_17095 [Planctomycetota bacterium]